MSTINDERAERNHNIHVCRVCIDAKCVNAVELKSENGWLSMFEFCVGVSLTPEDEPHVLCEKCAKTVKTYAKFKANCHKSDNFWRSVSVGTNKTNNAEKNKINEYNMKSENNIDKLNVSNTDNHFKFEPSPLNNSDIFEDDTKLPYDDSNIEIVEKDAHIAINDETNNESVTSAENKIKSLKMDKSYKVIKNLRSNTKTNADEEKQEAKCKFCKKQYRYKKWLLAHLASCTSKSKYIVKSKHRKCKKEILVCEKATTGENNLLEQAKEICNENLANLLFCGLCKFSSTNAIDINQHLNEHWASSSMECKLCNFVGVDSAHLAVHRYDHYPEKNKPRVQCHICAKNHCSRLSLQYHYRAIHLKKPGGLCWYCMKEFNIIIKWRQHVRRHESKFLSNYICDYCDKKFAYKHMIVEHMEHVHLGTRKFICETCGRVFSRNTQLTLHRKCMHEKSLPVKCAPCNRMFKNQISLVQHNKREHLLKPFKCNVCPKTFATNCMKTQHMIWHSDERPFKCSTCGSGYKARSQLKIHIRSHTGDRPYACQHCERSFASLNQLKVHSSVHTGVRAHKCNYCDRSFREKKQLQAHCTSRHKKTDTEKVV